jgi:hypothetical protein
MLLSFDAYVVISSSAVSYFPMLCDNFLVQEHFVLSIL